MPKLKTNYVAQATVKLGKTSVPVNIPIDLSKADDDFIEALQEGALETLSADLENAKVKLINKAELKAARKGIVKAAKVRGSQPSA